MIDEVHKGYIHMHKDLVFFEIKRTEYYFASFFFV